MQLRPVSQQVGVFLINFSFKKIVFVAWEIVFEVR